MRSKSTFAGVLLSVLLTLTCATAHAADKVWTEWVAVNDSQQNYLKVSFGRTGTSNTIYARLFNGYNLRVLCEITFDLVNGDTGAVRSTYAPFEAKAGATDESSGNWFILPGDKPTAGSYSVRNIRLKKLSMPMASDPEGSLYQVYPVNERAQQEQKLRDNAAAEQKRQADAAQQQHEATDAEQKRQADAAQQERAAQQQRQDEAAQQQRRQAEEAERAQRELNRTKTAAVNQIQGIMDDANRRAQGAQNTYQTQQNSQAEYERRAREIEDRYRNIDSSVDYSEVERELKLAESSAQLKRNAEAELQNYQNQAAYQNGAQKAVTLAAAAVFQNQVRKYANEEEEHRREAKKLEREANDEARKQRDEQEAAKQRELENLKKQAESNNWQNNTVGSSQQQFGIPSNNLPAPETPRIYIAPTPEQIKANQNLLTAWMGMSGNEDISKNADAWAAISQAILQGATDFNFKNTKTGATLLHYASFYNDVAATKYLLAHGMDAYVKDNWNHIPVEYAAQTNKEEIVTFWLSKDSPSGVIKISAMMSAASANADKVVAMLLAQGLSAEGSYLYHNSVQFPLGVAAIYNSDKVISLLLARGVDLKSRSDALSLAATKGNDKVITLLLAAGVDINEHYLGYPITNALDPPKGVPVNVDIVEKLIAAGADVNVYDSIGRSPLQLVREEDADKIIPLLLAAGADVNRRSKYYGSFPLHDSTGKKLELLLNAKGIDVNAKDEDGKTPLHWAMHPGMEKTVEQLLKVKGIDVNARDKEGDTPLHYASGNTVGGQYSNYSKAEDKISFDNIVRMLLAAGASPNLQNHSGETPLHTAADDGTDETIEMLLKAGAKRNIKTYGDVGLSADWYLKQRKKNKK
jgi:cytohesin